MPKQQQKDKQITLNIPEGGHIVICHVDWYHLSLDGSYMVMDFGYKFSGDLVECNRFMLHLSNAKRFVEPFAEFISKQPDSDYFCEEGLQKYFSPQKVIQVSQIDAANRSGDHAEMDFYHIPVAAINRREKQIIKDDAQAIPIARLGMPGQMVTSVLSKYIELLT